MINFDTKEDLNSILGNNPKLRFQTDFDKISEEINWEQVSRDEVGFIDTRDEYNWYATELIGTFFDTDTIPDRILTDFGKKIVLKKVNTPPDHDLKNKIVKVKYHSLINDSILNESQAITLPSCFENAVPRILFKWNEGQRLIDYLLNTDNDLNKILKIFANNMTLDEYRAFIGNFNIAEWREARADAEFPYTVATLNLMDTLLNNQNCFKQIANLLDFNDINIIPQNLTKYFTIDGVQIDKMLYYFPQFLILNDEGYNYISDLQTEITYKSVLERFVKMGYVFKEERYQRDQIYTIGDLSGAELSTTYDAIYPTKLTDEYMQFTSFDSLSILDRILHVDKYYRVTQLEYDLTSKIWKGKADYENKKLITTSGGVL